MRMGRFAFSALRQGISCSVGPPSILRKPKPLLHLNERLCIGPYEDLGQHAPTTANRGQQPLGGAAIFLNLRIGHKLVLLGIVFHVRSPCCCSYSSRNKTSRSTSARTNAGLSSTSSRFDNCSMTSRSIRWRFSAERLKPLPRRGRSWRIFVRPRRWMVVTEKNFKQSTDSLDQPRNSPHQDP